MNESNECLDLNALREKAKLETKDSITKQDTWAEVNEILKDKPKWSVSSWDVDIHALREQLSKR